MTVELNVATIMVSWVKGIFNHNAAVDNDYDDDGGRGRGRGHRRKAKEGTGKDGQNWRGLKRNAIRVFENC